MRRACEAMQDTSWEKQTEVGPCNSDALPRKGSEERGQ